MAELERWAEEGAMPEELELLELARTEQPSARSRARIAGALGAGVALSTASAAGAGASSASAFGLMKLAGTVLVLGAVGGGAAHFMAKPEAPARVAPPPSATPAKPVVASLPSAAAELPPEAAAATAPAEEAQPRPRPSAKSPAPSSLTQEIAALERVRKSLANGASEGALAELEEHDKRFPNGELAAESTVLRVQALLARGKQAEASALAEKFAATHPNSPYARRMLSLVKKR